MMMATRSVTFRDFLIFQLKLWLDGVKDIAVITLSEPVNDEYPTLTVIGTVKSYTRDDLLALLASFGAG